MLTGGSGADVPNASWSSANISGGAPGLDWGNGGGSTGTDATNDKLQSPAIFADPQGFYEAGRLLGSTKPPLNFIAEFWGAFAIDSGNEQTSGFGLVEAGGSAGVAADSFAWIYSNGTNYKFESGAGASALVGPAVAQQLLLHRIVVKRSDLTQANQTIQWLTSVDGITFTSQGTLAIETDLCPVSFGMFMGATNSPALFGTSYFYYI